MIEQIKDGGPAFPWQETDRCGNPMTNHSGMTLRDYFAAKAMQGFAADPEVDAGARQISSLAYAWADAMIAAREAKS